MNKLNSEGGSKVRKYGLTENQIDKEAENIRDGEDVGSSIRSEEKKAFLKFIIEVVLKYDLNA